MMGITPRWNGAIAVVGGAEPAVAWTMPATEADACDLLLLAIKDDRRRGGNPLAVIEAVHSAPKQGAFRAGHCYGMLRGFLITLGVPFDEIAPERWQKDLRCRTRGDRNDTLALAREMWPGMRITHATADALLLAHWGNKFGR